MNPAKKVRQFLESHKKQLGYTWDFAKNLASNAGRITDESNFMKYIEVAMLTKEDYTRFRNNLSLCVTNDSDWESVWPNSGGLWSTYRGLIKESGTEIEEIKTNVSSLEKKFKRAKLDGVEVLWTEEKNQHSPDGIHISSFKVKKGEGDKFRAIIPSLFERQYGRHINLLVDSGTYRFQFSSNTNFSWVENDLAKKYAEKIKKYAEHGYGRSFLFYGPPGTGKSNLARAIAAELDCKTLSFENLEAFLSQYNDSLLNDLIKILDIGVIIMDDLDSLGNRNNNLVLKKIEELRYSGKSLIATANKIKEINPALIRPGRFDEIKEVKTLDPRVVMDLVKQDKDLFDLVKNHPVASIKELMIRVQVEGKDEAKRSMSDILKRAKILQETDFDL